MRYAAFLGIAAILILVLTGCEMTGASVSGARGRYTFEQADADMKDVTTAKIYRIQIESLKDEEVGGGIRADFSDVDEDLFESQGLPAQELKIYDIYPFLNLYFEEDFFSIVFRGGPYYHQIDTKTHRRNRDLMTWRTFGARVSVEPQLRFDDFAVFAEGNAGRGITHMRDDEDELTKRSDERSVSYGYKFGGRYYLKDGWIELAYMYRRGTFDESNDWVERYGDAAFIPETKAYFRGFVLSVGWRF